MKTDKQTAERRKAVLDALDALPDEKIDYSDIPSRSAAWWTGTGRHYKPVKVQKTLRLDADVLAWFEADGSGYQTRINDALRFFMEGHRNPRRRSGPG